MTRPFTREEAEDVLAVECVVSPCCAFAWDASQMDLADGRETYTCPQCSEIEARSDLALARHALSVALEARDEALELLAGMEASREFWRDAHLKMACGLEQAREELSKAESRLTLRSCLMAEQVATIANHEAALRDLRENGGAWTWRMETIYREALGLPPQEARQ